VPVGGPLHPDDPAGIPRPAAGSSGVLEEPLFVQGHAGDRTLSGLLQIAAQRFPNVFLCAFKKKNKNRKNLNENEKTVMQPRERR